MTHAHPKDKPPGSYSESDTSCLDIYISDKQDSKALIHH